VDPRVEVVSMYLEQKGAHLHDRRSLEPDIGIEIAHRNHVPLYPTVGEAIGCGAGGVAVDGVVIIGEHGDYECNELGQKLYPRRRLFDAGSGDHGWCRAVRSDLQRQGPVVFGRGRAGDGGDRSPAGHFAGGRVDDSPHLAGCRPARSGRSGKP